MTNRIIIDVVSYRILLVKQYGKAHILINVCKIIRINKLFVFLYTVPKYNPITKVETSLKINTSGLMPITDGICPKPKTKEDKIIAIIVLFLFLEDTSSMIFKNYPLI